MFIGLLNEMSCLDNGNDEKFILVTTDENEFKFRLPLFNKESCEEFKNEFASLTNTSWNVKRTFPGQIRWVE